MSYIYLKGVCSMNFLKKSLSTILCCALTVNALRLSSIIANATESNSKEYVYDGYKINYDVTNSWGKSNDCFSNDDLYADVVSLGVNEIFSISRNTPLENVFNSFFSYSYTEDYVKNPGNILSVDDISEFTEKFTFSFFITKKIDQYNVNYNISDKDIQNGIDAFIDYLYDNYKCKIK